MSTSTVFQAKIFSGCQPQQGLDRHLKEKGGGKRLPKRTASELSDTAPPNLPLPVAYASELDIPPGRVIAVQGTAAAREDGAVEGH